MILTDAQRIAAMLGDDVSKAGLGRSSIRKNLWPAAVLIYQLDPAIGIYESTYSPMDEGLLTSGAPNVNFRKTSVRKTISDLEFSEYLL